MKKQVGELGHRCRPLMPASLSDEDKLLKVLSSAQLGTLVTYLQKRKNIPPLPGFNFLWATECSYIVLYVHWAMTFIIIRCRAWQGNCNRQRTKRQHAFNNKQYACNRRIWAFIPVSVNSACDHKGEFAKNLITSRKPLHEKTRLYSVQKKNIYIYI